MSVKSDPSNFKPDFETFTLDELFLEIRKRTNSYICVMEKDEMQKGTYSNPIRSNGSLPHLKGLLEYALEWIDLMIIKDLSGEE